MKTTKSVGNTLGLLPTIAISTAFAVPASAQSTDLGTIVVDNTPSAVSDAEGTGSVVTSKGSNPKATASVFNTPQTINTVSSQEIQQRGVTSVGEVLRTVPGVTLQAGEGGNPAGTAPIIRGYDANSDISIDGLRNASRTEYEAFNVESVQVNKGTSGTIGGRGAAGGTINIETKKARIGESFTDTALTYGSGNLLRETIDTNQTFDRGAVRFNLMRQTADDLNGRKNRSSDRFGAAAALTYQLTDKTTLHGGLYYYKSKDMPDYGIPFTTVDSDTGEVTTPAAYAVGSGTEADPRRPVNVDNSTWYGMTNRDFGDLETKLAFASLEHKFDNGLTWTTTLRRSEDKNSYVATVPRGTAPDVRASQRGSNRTTKTTAFNTQLSGNADWFGVKHSFVFGLEVSDEKTSGGFQAWRSATEFDRDALGNWVDHNGVFLSYVNPNNDTPWDRVGTALRSRTGGGTTKTKALYFADTIELNSQWQVNAGLRFDDFDATQTSSTGVVTSESHKFWSGNLGMVYRPTDNLALYASAATSAEPAFINAGIQDDIRYNDNAATLDPERTKSYEIGAKWAVNPNFLVGAAVFQIEKDNERIDDRDAGVTLQGGSSKSQGFELTFNGYVNDRLSISGGYTRIDYSSEDLAGRTTGYSRNVPKDAFSVWANYKLNHAWNFGLGATYTGEANSRGDNTAVAITPSSLQWDAMASYSFGDDWVAQLNVTNLFDEDVYGSGHWGSFVNMGPARTTTISISKRF